MGCPRKLNVCQHHLLVRNLRKVREQNPTFSLKDLMQASGLNCADVSKRTVNHFPLFADTKERPVEETRSHKARPILLCNEKSLSCGRLDKASSILLGWDVIRFQNKQSVLEQEYGDNAAKDYLLDAQQKAVRKELVVD